MRSILALAATATLVLTPAVAPAATPADPAKKPAPNAPTGHSTRLSVTDISGAPGYQMILMTDASEPGAGSGPHTHPGDQTLYIEQGDITVTLGDGPAMVYHPGEVVRIPAGVVHSTYNLTDKPSLEFEVLVLEKGKPAITLIGPDGKPLPAPARK